MPNYGFAIDLRKCIGCHACTIACKAEHDVPLGVNRCWVKTVEKGTFPDARRLFLPVLCNQCDNAPCVKICPTNALFKRRDGIVDLNGESCIGCRSCMNACPYDQLFIDPDTRTAEKCNFCANRVEQELLPSCVIVCPTECRIFGDLNDPSSQVAQLVARQSTTVRKPEKDTLPKIFYIGGDDAIMRPEVAVRPLMFREGQVVMRPLGSPDPDPTDPAAPRVDYDVPHRQPWGADLVAYLFAKGVATGALFLAAVLALLGNSGVLVTLVAPIISIAFSALTAGVLVIDLERPERFYYILTRSNWRSWLVWGAWFLTAHAILSTLWIVAWLFGMNGLRRIILVPSMVAALLATAYTGFLFAQGLARDLWQGPMATVDLVAQAGAAGAGILLIAGVPFGLLDPFALRVLSLTLGISLMAHVLLIVLEHVLAPSPTRHHELAVRTIVRGPFAQLFWGGAIVAGGLLPAIVSLTTPTTATPIVAAAFLALAGSLAWEYIWVEAGQSVPNS